MSDEGSKDSVEAVSLQQFMEENWDYFGYGELENKAELTLTQMSRQLPAGYYGSIREQLLNVVALTGFSGKFRIRVVVDSCIVVGDALRVAKGRPSSTERILNSEFIEVLAPGDIRDEVERSIRAELEEGSALEHALGHAKKLLSCMKLISEVSSASLARARQTLSNHLKDAPFLAVYFETDADAIVTHEKGTFDKPGVKKWDLGRSVDAVISFESGSLALVIAGAAVEAVMEAFQTLLVALLQALAEVIAILLDFVRAVLTMSLEALARIPDWARAILLGVVFAALLGYAFHEGFRSWVDSKALELRRKIGSFVTNLVRAIQKLWTVLKELLVLLWNTLLPITGALVVVGGVLIRRINRLLAMSHDTAATKS
jgi:predicted nucleic acid-binding protein